MLTAPRPPCASSPARQAAPADAGPAGLAGLRSTYAHPAFNIALEEMLRARLTARPGPGFFLTSRNGPSVIVGRNQDVRTELSPAARRDRLAVFRRTTGGGAVYHDLGNLNWSWIVPGGPNDRSRLLSPLLAALRSLGIEAAEGPRSALTACGRKIGGTACAFGRGVLLFHGTLLVSADLAALQGALAAHAPAYPPAGGARGVASVPSALANLADLRPGLGVADVEDALFDAVTGRPPLAPETRIDAGALADLACAYAADSWILNRQPPRTTPAPGGQP